MGYTSLARCVKDLELTGRLKRIDAELDANQEIAAVQRRVFAAGGPALLFTRVKGTPFPLVANLYGSKERLEYIFRDVLENVERLFALAGGGGAELFRHPFRHCLHLLRLFSSLLPMLPRQLDGEGAAVLREECSLAEVPKLISWPGDGGPFITLPLVYSEDPFAPGPGRANLGMYRIQLGGNEYADGELGLHYQIHRGIGVHHAHALEKGEALPVHIYVGGPPALTLAAVMPLPEGVSELRFAGLLQGQGVSLARTASSPLPFLADADFCFAGTLGPVTKPEGPFGDHLGYYSLRHPFPVLRLNRITHRPNAIWPFTTVGRPPQEDTVFGDFIHAITAPLLPKVFHGVSEVHAVDAAGVHPLLLALGSERYTPYEGRRKPRELLTEAFHLLGTTQTALAKFLFIAAKEDAPGLSCRDIPGFFHHVLERTDFSRDLHFIPDTPNDTLDYCGSALHEGSKLIWAVAGESRRTLACECTNLPDLPEGFSDIRLVLPGILVLKGPQHSLARGEQDPRMEELAACFAAFSAKDRYPLVVVVDDPVFAQESLDNFLWTTFTRTDPAQDTYGANAKTVAKAWRIEAPLFFDARKKSYHAPELEEDPAVAARIEAMAAQNGPLAGLF